MTNEEQPHFEITTISIKDLIVQEIENNLPIMPDLLTPIDFANHHLYSLYIEAMKCIACGMYNAGINSFGELLESTLREIIKIKTGKEMTEASFGQLTQFAESQNLLDPIDLSFFKWFNDRIRVSYAHQKMREIIGDHERPAFKIAISKENILESLKSTLDDIKMGKMTPIRINPLKDPTLAAIYKEPIDKSKALYLAWLVSLKLEQIISIYLNQKAYADSHQKFGSPF